MDDTPFTPPVITPVISALVARHAGDAAFYWSQLDWTLQSAQVGYARLHHFNRLLQAHLDGLAQAGTKGWAIAFAALERWQTPGEAFVCAWLALRSLDSGMSDQLLAVLGRRPDQLLRGAVSALAACSPEDFMNAARRWSALDASAPAQVIALRAAALRGPLGLEHLAHPLPAYLQSENPHLRAAGCRACAGAREPARLLAALQDASSDRERQVSAEAAIALGQLGQADAARPVLHHSVLAQASACLGASGAIRAQASRRLQRWTRELAWLTPIGAAQAQDLLAQLPPRTALTFALWHGDLAHLPFVIDQLANEDTGRYAGWVWQTLTGIDLAANGLALPEPDPASLDPDQLITETRRDADSGHPRTDPAALKAASAHLAARGKRVLLGREIDAGTALDLLDNAPQAIRVMAAQMLNRAQSAVRVSVRASTSEQRVAMDALRALHGARAAA
jgi:hypothetical protein